MNTAHQDFFWDLAASLLEADDVTKSTMMGYPCLRLSGNFFASVMPQSGNLVVKLPKSRVTSLIEEGAGIPFAPNGRQFKEWIQIADRNRNTWLSLMEEAMAFVA